MFTTRRSNEVEKGCNDTKTFLISNFLISQSQILSNWSKKHTLGRAKKATVIKKLYGGTNSGTIRECNKATHSKAYRSVTGFV
jgi:hypothetical protein